MTIYDRMHPFRTHEVCKKIRVRALGCVCVMCVSVCVSVRGSCTLHSEILHGNRCNKIYLINVCIGLDRPPFFHYVIYRILPGLDTALFKRDAAPTANVQWKWKCCVVRIWILLSGILSGIIL